MNSVLNEIAYTANEIATVDVKLSPACLLFYAKEATELGAYELAERYYVEVVSEKSKNFKKQKFSFQRITGDERNASYWFDYAVFTQRCGHHDKAMECAKEAISLDSKHFYR